MFQLRSQLSAGSTTGASASKRVPRQSRADGPSRHVSVKGGPKVSTRGVSPSYSMGNFFTWALNIVFKSPQEALKDAELKILQKFTNTSCQSQFIPISNNVEIRTLKFDLGFPKNSPSLVLLHGLMSGLGAWSPCFDLLAQRCPVYAIDLPGFGRSTCTKFFGDRSDIEYQFTSYIEEWRDAVGLESFVLVGHGFSGYLAALYTIRYPERVKHLILIEPWGFTELPFGIAGQAAKVHGDQEEGSYEDNIPSYLKLLNYTLNFINPVNLIRRLPFRIAKWIYSKFFQYAAPVFTDSTKPNKLISTAAANSQLEIYSHYIYQCNSLRSTGQDAYAKLNLFFFWAKSPVMYQIRQLDENIAMSFIYGSRSPMDHKTGYEVYHQRQQSTVEVYMVHNAGHNLFMDSPERLCDIVMSIIESECRKDSQTRTEGTFNGSEAGTEDLYWDCAWETINLSHANLNFVEGGIQDSLFEEWDDFEFDNRDDETKDGSVSYEKSEEDVFCTFNSS